MLETVTQATLCLFTAQPSLADQVRFKKHPAHSVPQEDNDLELSSEW